MEAVIFIGIQATGKSTFFKQRFFQTHIRLNMDMLRTRHREAILLRACLEAKQPFVVDNTNPSIEERIRYILPAKAHHFRVVGYYFQSNIVDALARNAARPEKERIPEKGIRAAYKRLQLPSRSEGFDQLYYVKMAEAGEILVQEWSDEV
jgi:predicted kinase